MAKVEDLAASISAAKKESASASESGEKKKKKKKLEEVARRQEKVLDDLQELQSKLDRATMSSQALELKQQQEATIERLTSLFNASNFGGSQARADEALRLAKEEAHAESAKDFERFLKTGKVVGVEGSGGSLRELDARFDRVLAQMKLTSEQLTAFAAEQGIAL